MDQTRFADRLPATTVTLHASAPAAAAGLPGNAGALQLPGHPALAGGHPSACPAPGRRLAGRAQPVAATGRPATAGRRRPGQLPARRCRSPPAPDTEGAPLTGYCWGVSIAHRAQPGRQPADPADTGRGSGSRSGSPWLDGLYLVGGAAAGDTERLYGLWTYLAAGTDGAALYLLYPPNATSVAPLGYASDAVDPQRTVLLKTNLSTVTRDPGRLLAAFPRPTPTARHRRCHRLPVPALAGLDGGVGWLLPALRRRGAGCRTRCSTRPAGAAAAAVPAHQPVRRGPPGGPLLA